MDGFIHITAIALIIGYAAFAVWFICKRQTIWGIIGSSAGLLCGGVFIVPVAEAIASFICWGIVVAIVLAIIGAVAN